MSASNEETSSPVVAPNDVKIDVEDPVEESEAPIKEPSAPVKENEVPLKEASGPVKEVENEKPIDQDEDDEEPPNIMKDLLPWIVTAGIGVILLIAAVIVMATRKEQTFRFPYTTEEFNIPDYLGSVRVKSVGGQDLRYISELRQIGSPASRATRYKLEPQLEYIYGNASLPVDNVVVIAFKYGASNTLASRTRRSVSGRSGNDGNEHSVVAKHWLYLKKNITKSTEDLQTDFVAALSKVPGIVVDETSIKLESLENMTKAQAIVALAQAGFFSKKYGQLDQELLDIFGLNPIIDIQTDDDDEEGLCRSLSHPSNGKVYPQACTTSISTYAKMACSFTCDPGFDLEGSPNRICMGSGLWSGEPVKCHKKCPPLEHSTVGSITPQSCSHANSSSGQLCFTECPSENYQMIFPSPTTVEKKLDMPGADLFDFNNYALKEDAVDPLDDVRTYLQRCGSDGEWNGIVGTCKTKCATLVPPENGVVEPSTCVSNPLEGDECSVSCSPGFAMADGADYKLLTCEVTGTWTGEISPCHESCPMHSTNNSVNVSPLICMSSTYEGLSCKYSCDAGNSLVGASKRTCHGGSWDAEEPTCVQLCDALPNPENGVFMSTAGPCSDVTLLEGTECIVHCDTGSRAVENSTVCLLSGQWSRENITCEKMCRPLVPDRYGDWSPAGCTGSHFCRAWGLYFVVLAWFPTYRAWDMQIRGDTFTELFAECMGHDSAITQADKSS